jgi:r-opsin
MGGLTGTVSIMTLTGIALDRYSVILHPLNPMKKTTHYKALGMISCVWIYSGTFAVLPLLGLNNYVSEGYLTSCSFDYLDPALESRIFIFVFFIGAWLVPVSIIVFAYAAIFRVVLYAERIDFFKGGASAKESFRNR